MNKKLGWAIVHLEKLRAFSMIVRHGSFVTAAKELGVTQPGLSRMVSTLEEAAGKKLLERSRLGSRPTPAGMSLHHFFLKLEPMLVDLEIKIDEGESAGFISVGTFETFSISWWPEFFKSFSAEVEKIHIGLRTIDQNPHEALLSQSLLAIVEAVPVQHESIRSEKITEDSFGVFKAKKSKKKFNAKESSFFYVPYATDNSGKKLTELTKDLGILTESKHALSSFSAVSEFIISDNGAGVLPMNYAQKLLGRNQIEQLPDYPEFGKHDICISYLEENRSDLRIQTLKRELKRFFKKAN